MASDQAVSKDPTLEFEESCFAAGHELVIGIDEVGRGALAGPVAVGAAVPVEVLPLGLGCAPSGAHATRVTARAAAKTAVTAGAIVGGVLMVLLVSVIVMVLSCLLGWVVARISLKLKHKSFITVILSLLFLAAYYFVYYKAQALITLLVGLSLWPWGAGLLVTGPLLGHASWHAYRAALEPQEPVPSE